MLIEFKNSQSNSRFEFVDRDSEVADVDWTLFAKGRLYQRESLLETLLQCPWETTLKSL